jgi:hypothetical protein
MHLAASLPKVRVSNLRLQEPSSGFIVKKRRIAINAERFRNECRDNDYLLCVNINMLCWGRSIALREQELADDFWTLVKAEFVNTDLFK